jgi:signal peptidase
VRIVLPGERLGGIRYEEAAMSGRSLPVSRAGVRAKEGKAWVRPRRLLDIVGYLALAFCLALLGSLLTVAATNLLGYQNFVIYSGSMEPTVKVGSLLLTRPVDVDDLRVSDVVTYRSPGNHTTLTHRIVSIRQEDGDWVFKTKGDASLGPDPQEVILHGQVSKMAFDIPYLGYVVDFARSTQGIVLFLLVPAAGLLLIQGLKMWKARAIRGVQ